jgi:hypothetical protein
MPCNPTPERFGAGTRLATCEKTPRAQYGSSPGLKRSCLSRWLTVNPARSAQNPFRRVQANALIAASAHPKQTDRKDNSGRGVFFAFGSPAIGEKPSEKALANGLGPAGFSIRYT